MVRLSLALLLLCVCATVSAREVRLQSPNGETGTCPEVEAQVATAQAPKTHPPHTAAARGKAAAKPAQTSQGGGGDASTVRNQGPRWHSFLPGMFR